MTEVVKQRLEFLLSREYRKIRKPGGEDVTERLKEYLRMMRMARLFEIALESELPVMYGNDIFGFNRGNTKLPEYKSLNFKGRWGFGNVTVDYETPLSIGLSGIRDQVLRLYPASDSQAREFYDAVFVTFDACERLVEKYRKAAEKCGNIRLSQVLSRVPMMGARDYYQALVTVKFMQFALRLNRTVHVTLGRFDQYMKPYFDASLSAGATEAELTELTELFFISLNFDTDIYTGVQQGDNGQSMVLGGCTENGDIAFNRLSEICLTASEELRITDPKINLRVNRNTPLSLYERGTRLTRQGLGFPQYSNDDVIIKVLTQWGYSPEDARDYIVAACWEFIVPRFGGGYSEYRRNEFPPYGGSCCSEIPFRIGNV